MKKQNVFRLLSLLFLTLAMGQPANASGFINWLRDFFNDYYNNPENGDLCYSKVNAQTGIGEGKVYVEWARKNTNYNESYASDKLVTEISVQSPNDNTAKKPKSATNTTHKYVFCAKGNEGWEFENVYSDADFQSVYNPHDAQTTDDGFYAAKVEVTTGAMSQASQPVANLYARFALKDSLNKYGYSTLYYSNYNFKVPGGGVTATTYTFDSNNKQLLVSKTYREGDVIPAGEAVVLKGTANTVYKFIPVKGNHTPDAANVLRGTDTETQLSGDGKFYALSAKSGVVGFYWMNSTGSAFKNGAHKAYLHLSSSAGSVKGFAFDDDDATGIQAIENTIEDAAIYNIAGQRVGKMQKGINIVNGKKIMVK